MDQNQFESWARVEVMGKQSHVGYVTTETYGQAVLFRVDQPALPGGEETLDEAEWVGDVYAQPGSVVVRAPIEAMTVLLGAGSIYRIVPCDEATAMRVVKSSVRRPLKIVNLVTRAAISSPSSDDNDDDHDDDPEHDL